MFAEENKELMEAVLSLLERAPAPTGDIIKGADIGTIMSVEKKLFIKFTDDLISWLSHVNGSLRGPGGLYGVQTDNVMLDMQTFLIDHPDWSKQNWIPLAGDGCGNTYIAVPYTEYLSYVAFFDLADNELVYVVASNVWKFMLFLLEKEVAGSVWPFNEAYVKRIDPDIINLPHSFPLPWNA